MSLPAFSSATCKRLGVFAVLALLAGCTAPQQTAVVVTSPPAPRFGSGPIAAYDSYALAMFKPTAVSTTANPAITDIIAEAKVPASRGKALN
jgi:hypothetical protein